jgi:hypothetical protein
MPVVAPIHTRKPLIEVMKIALPLLAVTLSITCLLAGCQSPGALSQYSHSKSRAPQSLRNNCYSLLYQLLEQQKDVSILRFIKPEQSDVKKLMIRISTASGTGAKYLEEFAKADPTINLNDIRLPPGEVATRDAIASTEKHKLLGQTGDTFALTLLLTQTEALTYASHLAKVAGQNEPNPQRAHTLAGISEEMENLYNDVFTLLLSKIQSPATNSIRIHGPATPTNSIPADRILMIDSSSMTVGGGEATLTVGPLQYTNGIYSGDYEITVFPYFFKNEKGTLAMNVPDDSLAAAMQGKVTAISGTATTTTGPRAGHSRHIDAIVTPVDDNHGTLKLWFMAGTREMIFNPSYHVAEKKTTNH